MSVLRTSEKCSGSKAGIGSKAVASPSGERIADREHAGVRQADDVAGERDVDRLAVGREQLHRAREPHVFAGAHVAHGHVALELAAAHAQERDAVAMARVHVRLNLEHEAGEAVVGRFDAVFLGVDARGRRRAHAHERVEEQLDAEVRHRAAEEHRRDVAAQHRVVVEARARAFEQLELIEELAVRALVDQRSDRRIARRRRFHRRALRTVLRALERVHLARFAVVHAAERLAVAQRPVHRVRADPEHVLQLVEQFERVARRAVHLVDEREQRDAARAADREQLARLRLDAFGGVDQHHGGVGGEQRAVGVFAEVLMARRVEQVHRVAAVRELQHRRGDRDAALALELHPVRRGRPRAAARRHLAGGDDRPAVQQQLLGERRLAGIGVRDDRERAPFGDFLADFHVKGPFDAERAATPSRRFALVRVLNDNDTRRSIPVRKPAVRAALADRRRDGDRNLHPGDVHRRQARARAARVPRRRSRR